jgi:glucan phosphoethanolaminetransferase (alkaline phosphatase superfamily)
VHIFFYFLFNFYIRSVCTPWFHNTLISSCSHTGLNTNCQSLQFRIPYIVRNVKACRIRHVLLYTHSLTKRDILMLSGLRFLLPLLFLLLLLLLIIIIIIIINLPNST